MYIPITVELSAVAFPPVKTLYGVGRMEEEVWIVMACGLKEYAFTVSEKVIVM